MESQPGEWVEAAIYVSCYIDQLPLLCVDQVEQVMSSLLNLGITLEQVLLSTHQH